MIGAIVAAVLAALVLALLWPEERGTAAGRARAVLFAAMAAVVGLVLAARQTERAGNDSTGRAFQAYTQGMVAAKFAEAGDLAAWLAGDGSTGRGGEGARGRGGEPETPAQRPAPAAKPPIQNPKAKTPHRPRSAQEQTATMRRDALRSYAEAVRLAPEATLFRRQYAILLADAGRREEALRQFREVARILEARSQAAGPVTENSSPRPSTSKSQPSTRVGERLPPVQERALWEQLYGPRPPRPADLPRLESQLRALRLGWFEHLVRRSVYRRMGLKERAAAATEAARREALAQVLLLTLLTFCLFGTAVLGLGLLVAAFIAWRTGRFRPVAPPVPLNPGAAPLLEAFVLYLFLYVSPALLGMLGLTPRWRPSERTAELTAVLQLGVDLLALVALAYLWVRLRAAGRKLAEVGLHTRELGRNILYGFGGYAAALPLVIGSGILASWLGRRFFPEVAPPFHPIQAMTATAPSGWVRLALMVVVVVGAPVLEEIFFRGLLYGGLRRRFGVAAGIVASATVFSLLHPQLPLGFLPIFVLAAVFAGLYEWRQSLVPGIVMHAVNNGVIWVYLNVMFPPG